MQIQNRGTIAGNLCNASPAADGAPPLLALEASVELVSARGTRIVALDEFLIGNRRTARQADEIMTAILAPRRLEQAQSSFVKLGARKYLVISIVMAAVLVDVGDDRRIRTARIAVGSASETARRLRVLEARLVGMRADAELRHVVEEDDLAGLSPIDDVRASAAYRLIAARHLVGQALVEATRRADG